MVQVHSIGAIETMRCDAPYASVGKVTEMSSGREYGGCSLGFGLHVVIVYDISRPA